MYKQQQIRESFMFALADANNVYASCEALIFINYALYVIVSGYREFMVAGVDLQSIVTGRRP